MNLKKLLTVLLVFVVVLAGAFLIARQGNLTADSSGRADALANVMAPAGLPAGQNGDLPESTTSVAEPVTSIPLRDMPAGEYAPQLDWYQLWLDGELDLEFDGIPPALRATLLEEALNLPASTYNPASGGPPTLIDSFDSINSNDCCGGGVLTPPDPEMAAGPNHVIAVVNAALEIYDKNGVSLVGPTTFTTFYSALGGPCVSFPFDPNVLYDEEYDRFIIAADGDGDSYCVGVSATADPTGAYYLYDFTSVDVGGAMFDYPHAGVGDDAIYLGANLFGSGQGYAYAMDKVAMYNNNAAAIVTQILSGGFHTTPQPYNAHGWADGTWPTGPHYIFAGTGFSNASTYQLYSWDDPFGANNFQYETSFNLPAIHGKTVGIPINSSQMGGSGITGNDPRPLDFEYRNGSAWTAMTVSCNPGGGTVNGIQWAEIDLATQTVAQTDVFCSNGEFRYFPDFAVDACDNGVVGYTRSSASSWPSVYAAGPVIAGANPGETLVKAGEEAHYTYSNRWGDYTGMTIDPDGVTFWYLGEYAKTNGNPQTNWGNYIGELTLDCNSNAPEISLDKTVGTTPGVCAATDSITVTPGTDVYYCYEVTNTGTVTLTLHDLQDSELGGIFSSLAYTLTPGASVDTVAAGLNISTTINMTTTNTATWTAYNPGPSDVVTATDTATVTLDLFPAIAVDPAGFDEEMAPNTQLTLPLTISNTGYSPLNWTIYEETSSGGGSCAIDDITWVSTDPVSGTTGIGSGEMVDVIFDSTSLANGVYTGTLCVESNDPVNVQTRLALTLTVTDEVEYLHYLPIILNQEGNQPEASSGGPAPLTLGVMALPVGMVGMWLVSRSGRYGKKEV